jgi:ABC-type Na+ efflux pump permease subunit
MNLLAIVERELRVNARRSATFSGRAMMGAVCAVVGIGTAFAMSRGVNSNRMGLALFSSVAGLTAMFAAFAGAGSTSDCISVEKREGTLGLLFLTRLKPYDIVLGKFAASTLLAFYSILAVFPVLTLGVLMGGVQFVQVAHMSVALLNLLFFSGALGIFTSCLCRRAERAGGAAMGGAVFFWMGCGALSQALTQWGVLPGLAHALRLISPQSAFEIALGAMNPGAVGRFWPGLLCSNALGWMFLAIACLILPHVWQDRPDKARGLPWGERMAQWRLGRPADRARHRRWGLDLNPFFWLSTREFSRPRHPWYFLGLVVVAFVSVHLAFPDSINPFAVVAVAIGTTHLVLRMWIASEATERVAQERQNGTLELILSTPIRVEEILKGHGMAMRRMFAGPLIGVLLLDAVLGVLVVTVESWSPKDVVLAPILLGGAVILVLDSVAMVWQGLWAGLSEKRAQAAAGNVLVRVLFLPWFGIFLILMLGAWIQQARFAPDRAVVGGLWFCFSVLNAIYWFRRSRRKLAAEFRTRAMERFLPEEDRPAVWKRLGRWTAEVVAQRRRR